MLGVEPREAKGDVRLRTSGALLAFHGRNGVTWPLEPKSLFYDWIYLNTLKQNPVLASALNSFDAFTDIEFNPQKSFSCQARSCAIWVSLVDRGLIDTLDSEATFRDLFLVSGELQTGTQEPLL